MKRKMMTLLLAMVLLLNMNICIYAESDGEYIGDLSRFVTTGTAPKFKDVSQSAWYYNNVNTVALSGLMKGKSATTFDPDSNMTVAEAVTVAARFWSVYTDTPMPKEGKTWYSSSFELLTDAGIISPTLSARAEKVASRGEIARIFVKILEKKDLEDINVIYQIPDYTGDGAEDILEFYRAGILTGNDAFGTFAPQTAISRSQIAAIVARMMDPKQRKKVYFVAPLTGQLENFVADDVPVEYTDVSRKSWYHDNVEYCTQTGLMTGIAKNKFSPQGTLTVAELITIGARFAVRYGTGSTEMLDILPKGQVWYHRYFTYLEKAKVIDENWRTRANQSATREDMIRIFSEIIDTKDLPAINTVGYIPDYSLGNYVTEALAFYNAGILTGGDEYGSFYPQSSVTRSETAAILSRMAQPELRKTFTLKTKNVAESFTYGTSGAGRALKGYRVGSGANVMVLTFAIHGWEDNFARDGQELVNTAEQLYTYLKGKPSLTDGWSVYILPCLNPDGLQDGNSHNGSGRCTVYSYDKSGKKVKVGIDLNRSFPTNYRPMGGSRNYNGSKPLAAPEAVAVKDFLNKVYSNTGKNIAIDTHGWYNQIIVKDTNGVISQAFCKYFPSLTKTKLGGNGYLSTYAQSIGYQAGLFEFPDVSSHSQFVSREYSQKFINAITYLLNHAK